MESNQEKDVVSATTETIAPEITPAETVAPTVSEVASLPTETVLALEAPLPFYKKHPTLLASIFAGIVILGAGYFAYTTYYAHGGTVAVVNGKHIYRDEFNESVALIIQGATAQGADIAQESVQAEIRTQALDILVNNALITSAATEAGIVATDEEIQSKYDEIITQLGSKEELEKRMAEVGLTEEKLRSNISDRILADAYINSKATIKDLAVTEEEVNAFILGLGTGAGELPPLEEIRPQIEEQILGQKQQQLITDIITKLREEGDVDIRI